MADTDPIGGARQQFQEQIDFFRKKLNLPTETWRDIQLAANDRAFVVAGAMKADLLNDLRKAVGQAVEGGSFGAFRKQFDEIVAKHGWTGWTGQGSAAGEAWRTRVIYQTNVATSYAAGRRAQLLDPEMLAHRPYWRYVHSDGVAHPRPYHKQWGDMKLTLRYDDPFWDTHYPPNGWGCKCRVVPVAKPNDGDATEPPDGWHQDDPRTGAPVGIDEGWNYAPGARADADMRSFVQNKLIEYPPAISKALSAEVTGVVNAQERIDSFVQSVLSNPVRQDDLWIGFVQQPENIKQLAGVDATDFTLLIPADSVRETIARSADGGSLPHTSFQHVEQLANASDSMKLSPERGPNGELRLAVAKVIGTDLLSALFEVRSDKKIRSLAFISMWLGD